MALNSICDGFMNCSQSVGKVVLGLTSQMTGDIVLTLLLILICIIAIALMFGIPLEFTAILIVPLILAYMAYFAEFVTYGLILMVYLAFLFGKNFIFR